jgi:apolipoprotein N-acyltransferase
MTLPLLVFGILSKKTPTKFHFILIVACWITFEYFHFRWEAHWPWLALGHYLMDQSWLMQWYEWTGVLGGTVWILAMAWSLYLVLTKWKASPRKPLFIRMASVVLIPIIISAIIQMRQKSDLGEPMEVAIVQPNYEPHYVKGKIPPREEVRHFLDLANQVVTKKTNYLIFPETSFSIRLNNWDLSSTVLGLRNYLRGYPKMTLISGLETNKILAQGEAHDQYTRTYIRNLDTIYWENHNSAVRMSATMMDELYYKSKLVPGAEFFPFKKALFFLKPLMDKLGGSGSGLRMQAKRSAFEGFDGHKVAPVICYESIFGEYVSGYMNQGAEWIAVMTNDGWWDNTAGHRQHLGLSVIRAIEQRKWVARSANSGISCFIDPKGSITQPSRYGVEAAISGQIYANTERTIYSRMGDIIGRLAILILCGAILFYFHRRFVKKLG